MAQRTVRAVLGALVLLIAPLPARAQSFGAGAEAASDDVRAGISWSGGRASASVDARLAPGAFDASLRLAHVRGAQRHAGADLAADLTLGRDWSLGTVTVRTEITGHLFAGAARRMDFAEVAIGARYGIGPLRIAATAWYAPRQGSIGGDNLHLRMGADAGLPGLPISVLASIGYTTGSSDVDPRAARLRPGGDYADWKLGAEVTRYPLTVGVDYVGTDIAPARSTGSPFAAPATLGDRVVARVRFAF